MSGTDDLSPVSSAMDGAKVPMRGKIKDAEAEALLKLLRREQQYEQEQSIPQIQRREPLPAIGVNPKSTSIEKAASCFPIQDQLLHSNTQSLREFRFSDTEIINDSSFVRTSNNNNNVLPGHVVPSIPTEVFVPPYSWKNEKTPSCARFERSGKNGRTLPPLEYSFGPSGEGDGNQDRPSCPRPSSPRHWPGD